MSTDIVPVLGNVNVTITEVGLTNIHLDSYDEWAAIGPALGRASRSLAWAIGDWLNYGEWRWGEMYAQAADDTGLSVGRLRNLKWLASQVPYENRIPGLSLSHHEAVAPLPSDEQRKLLQAAVAFSVTRDDMRKVVNEFRADVGEVLPRYQQVQPDMVLEKAARVVRAFMHSPVKTTDMTLHEALIDLCRSLGEEI
jgi:hypothetical protein